MIKNTVAMVVLFTSLLGCGNFVTPGQRVQSAIQHEGRADKARENASLEEAKYHEKKAAQHRKEASKPVTIYDFLETVVKGLLAPDNGSS